MNCPECKVIILINSEFCPYCGAELDRTIKTLINYHKKQLKKILDKTLRRDD